MSGEDGQSYPVKNSNIVGTAVLLYWLGVQFFLIPFVNCPYVIFFTCLKFMSNIYSHFE